ncbi:hypothetical protein ACWCXK_00840 [Streptomyces sp. NPDC001739]
MRRPLEALWPQLTPETVVHALLTDAEKMALHLPSLTYEERSRLLRTPGAGWTDADGALLDEAAALVEGPPERIYGHIVVDEAQELTAMQWRMALRRCPSRSMTLVGDFAQAGPMATERTWAEALHPHVGARYRSPKPAAWNSTTWSSSTRRRSPQPTQAVNATCTSPSPGPPNGSAR